MTSNHAPGSQPTRPRAQTKLVVADLDTQIEQLERRLIDREAWLQSTAESLVDRAKLAVTPKPWVLPMVGVGVVLWLGWRLWRRRDPERHVVRVNIPATVAEHHREGLVDLPWAGLTALGWPLVPVSWRERLSPAGAAAIVSSVLSIGRRLLRRRIR